MIKLHSDKTFTIIESPGHPMVSYTRDAKNQNGSKTNLYILL